MKRKEVARGGACETLDDDFKGAKTNITILRSTYDKFSAILMRAFALTRNKSATQPSTERTMNRQL